MDVEGGKRIGHRRGRGTSTCGGSSSSSPTARARGRSLHELNSTRHAQPARRHLGGIAPLFGDSGKGLGLLNNELYIGRVVWNRRQWLKDPDTGKRRYVDRPRGEWLVREDESLRIVPAELWQRARERERRGPARGARTGKGASPRTLFGGLLRCNACGGPMVAINAQALRLQHPQRSRRHGMPERPDRSARRRRCAACLPNCASELLEPRRRGAARKRRCGSCLLQHQRAAGGDAEASSKRLAGPRGEIARLVDAVAAVGISDSARRAPQGGRSRARGTRSPVGQRADARASSDR